MKNKISISDFQFVFSGYGYYKVIYTSPVTQKKWRQTTNNMPLIDATYHAEEPKKKDLERLKWEVKNYGLPFEEEINGYAKNW